MELAELSLVGLFGKQVDSGQARILFDARRGHQRGIDVREAGAAVIG